MSIKRLAKIMKKIKDKFEAFSIEIISLRSNEISIRVISQQFQGMPMTTRFKNLARYSLSLLNEREDKTLFTFEAWTAKEFLEIIGE